MTHVMMSKMVAILFFSSFEYVGTHFECLTDANLDRKRVNLTT